MPITRFYRVRGDGWEWARFWITDDGCLSILSDYGNYGYWWGSPGREFRLFLCGVSDHYLIGKLNSGEPDEYDGDATLRRVKLLICDRRRRKELTREQARDEWWLLREHSYLDSVSDLQEWYWHGTKLDIDPADGVAVYRKPIQLQMFVKKLWPLFVQQLRTQLLGEKARAWFTREAA